MYMGTHVHYVVELLSGDRLTVMLPNVTNNYQTLIPQFMPVGQLAIVWLWRSKVRWRHRGCWRFYKS
jgi:hypothetical protein